MSSLASAPSLGNPTSRTVHFDPHEVPDVFKRAFPGYRGRTYTVRVTDEVTLDSNSWSGGTRYSYRGVNLTTGAVCDPQCQEYGNPFANPEVPTVALQPDMAIVCHKVFQGKDLGICIHVHPANVRKLLPAPAELTADEAKALDVICGIKGGHHRRDEWARRGLPGEYGPENPLIASLAVKRLVKVNRAGAVAATTAGRNARQSR